MQGGALFVSLFSTSRLDIPSLLSPLLSLIESLLALVHSPLLSFLSRLFSGLLLVLACVQGVGAAEGGERGRGLGRRANTDREGAPVWRRAACGVRLRRQLRGRGRGRCC